MQSLAGKVAQNIGLIVLASQDLERHLKTVVAASGDASRGSIIQRHDKLERRSLGEVVAGFLRQATITGEGGKDELQAYLSRLLDRRNKVVHHFFDTYGQALEEGRETEVFADLAALHGELVQLRDAFMAVNQAWLDVLLQEEDKQTPSG